MQSFKVLALFSLVLFSGFSIKTTTPYLTKWVLSKECSLKVNGSTNINKFSCVIANYYTPDTLVFYKEKTSEPVKMAGSMALDVQNFDCHNPIMTNDLRKTLKVKEYPKMIIRFINLSKYPDAGDRQDGVKGVVTIELSGIIKRFDVNYKFIQDGPNALTLIGTKQVNFSDFNITPPRKLGGMIKTNNELNVEFVLKVKILNLS